LHPKIIEICDLLKTASFDYIIIETVGVGQSEIEIAGLADITAVVLVPEAGDEVQTMKAGLMEIADLFIVNKADRPGADLFVKNLRSMLSPAFNNRNIEVPVLKTVASQGEGIVELFDCIKKILAVQRHNSKRFWLLAEKAYQLIRQKRMQDIDKEDLKKRIEEHAAGFNLYSFIKKYD
jgi:LAO/AO transport system kinase